MKNWKKSLAMFAIALVLGLSMMPAKLFANSTVSAGTFAELLAAFDATWEADSGTSIVTLTDDITQTYGDEDYLAVNAGWDFTLNLGGHTLTLRNDGARGLTNYGKLTITGNGIITNGDSENESYGLIDNYGGEVVVKNGTFIDYGLGGGATLKNRTVKNSGANENAQGVMTIEAANIHAYGHAAGNACVYSDGALTISDGVVMTNDATDELHNGYFGSYAVTVNSGTATIGNTAGAAANPVVINGNRGGLAVNSGTATVNNGVISGGLWYGIWITNNGNRSSVDIKYAEATGKIYGVYSTVDDGKQDLSDVKITVAGGKYTGGTKAAVAINASKSEHSWGMEISGGEFSTEPDASYLAAENMVYSTDDAKYPYAVAAETKYSLDMNDVAISYGHPATVVPVITPTMVGSYANPNATYTVTSNNDEISYDKTTGVISTSSTVATDGTLTFKFFDDVEKVIKVSVTGLQVEVKNEEEVDEDAQKIVDAVIAGDTAEKFEYVGEMTRDDIINAIVNGDTIATAVNTVEKGAEDVTDEEFLALAKEIDELEDAQVAGYYDIDVALMNATRGAKIGKITELANEIAVTVDLPMDLPAVAEGYERAYHMVRYHNGVTDILDAVDNGDGTLTFKSGLFSTYALVYVDTLVATAPDTGIYSSDMSTGARISQLSTLFVAMTAVLALMLARKVQLMSWQKQRENAKK